MSYFVNLKNLLSQNKKKNKSDDLSIHDNLNTISRSHKNNFFRKFFCCFPKKKGPLIDLDDPLLQDKTIVEV